MCAYALLKEKEKKRGTDSTAQSGPRSSNGRDLYPATYLAALFTGQEAVCPVRSPLLFCDIIADSARPRAHDTAAVLFCGGSSVPIEHRKKLARLYPLRRRAPARSRRWARVRPSTLFFCTHFITPFHFLSFSFAMYAILPLPRDQVPAFTVVRVTTVSPFLYVPLHLPPVCLRTSIGESVRSSIFNRSSSIPPFPLFLSIRVAKRATVDSIGRKLCFERAPKPIRLFLENARREAPVETVAKRCPDIVSFAINEDR